MKENKDYEDNSDDSSVSEENDNQEFRTMAEFNSSLLNLQENGDISSINVKRFISNCQMWSSVVKIMSFIMIVYIYIYIYT